MKINKGSGRCSTGVWRITKGKGHDVVEMEEDCRCCCCWCSVLQLNTLGVTHYLQLHIG